MKLPLDGGAKSALRQFPSLAGHGAARLLQFTIENVHFSVAALAIQTSACGARCRVYRARWLLRPALLLPGLNFANFSRHFSLSHTYQPPARSGLFFVQNQNSITVAHMAQKDSPRAVLSCRWRTSLPGRPHSFFVFPSPASSSWSPSTASALLYSFIPLSQLLRTRQARQ